MKVLHKPGSYTLLKVLLAFSLTASLGAQGPADQTEAVDVCAANTSSSGAANRFLLHPDGTATDQTTGLTWTRCGVGQRLQAGECVVKTPGIWFSWTEAVTAAVGRLLDPDLQGSGWRVPALNELQSLIRNGCGLPAINTEVFPDPGFWEFWTSTSDENNNEFAWAVDFKKLKFTAQVKEITPLRVRLVRGASLPLPDPDKILIWNDGIHDITNDNLSSLQSPQDALKVLPVHQRGGIDWITALNNGTIAPRTTVTGDGPGLEILDQEILFTDTGPMPYVMFPHRPHSQWLSCENCHDDPFPRGMDRINIAMQDIWTGKYCGKCHGNVAFSTHQCIRCHSVPHENSLKLE